MAIAIGTSPARIASASGDAVTASFTPAAGALLVAAVMGGTPTGGSLTWTQRASAPGAAGMKFWTASVTTSASMTVNASNGAARGLIKVWVVTGASHVGVTGTGTSTADPATVNAYTSTLDGSRGFAFVSDYNVMGVPTSTDDEEGSSFPSFASQMVVSKAANTSGVGTTVQFNLDAPSSSPSWEWLAVEIVPPSRQPLMLQALTAVHHATSW